VRGAVNALRNGEGPQFIELRTYRFRAHSMFDAELYRSKQEVDEWRLRCPIAALRTQLQTEGLITEADIEAFEADIEKEIGEAVAFAESGTWESVADSMSTVYTELRT
jgi:TPP-dependent pyruvate/acetoin dehydrogenase alpha subunit